MLCLKGVCQYTIKDKMINHILEDKHKEKYQRLKQKEQYRKKQKGKNIMNCVIPDCEDLVIIDPTYEDRFYTCGEGHKFCSVCKIRGHHDESKCKNVKKFIIFFYL